MNYQESTGYLWLFLMVFAIFPPHLEWVVFQNELHLKITVQEQTRNSTENLSQEDAFDQIEMSVRFFRKQVCGYWVMVQLWEKQFSFGWSVDKCFLLIYYYYL